MTKISTIRFVERKQVDVLKYNQLIELSSDVSIYCYSWYLDTVCDNWACLVLGNYEVVFPFAYTVKFGQKIIYQPFFTREFSFFGIGSIDEVHKIAIFDSIPKEFKKIDLALNTLLELPNYEVSKVVNQELRLNESYENIYNHYSTNAKRLIKKALKANCIIDESNNVKEFILFFKTHTGNQVNYEEYHYDNLRALIQVIIDNKKGTIYQVKLNGLVVSQGVYLFQKHRITYLKGTSSSEGKKNGAMFLLMDSIIKENKTSANVFDFGGSRISSIAGFYNKFGAKDRVYYQYSKNEHSWILKKGKILRDFLKK